LIFYSFDLGGKRFTSIKDIGTESLKELSATSLKESQNSLNQLGEGIIKQKAIDVAGQIEIFTTFNPKVKREELFQDPWLKTIAVQKVGETGYSAVHDNKGINHFHVNPKIVETDLRALSGKYPAFWKILEASLTGPASGYYDWPEADGTVRSKYMYLSPIKGTDLIVAATTYIDEFSKPVKVIEGRMMKVEKEYLDAYRTRIQLFYFVILAALVFLLIVTFFYSRSVIRPIRQLADVADKISMGDLETSVKIKAKGEVGLLAESIDRMQTSVKAAIERMQKRKETK
jgi:HAMP domain-containing protein